ncbi:MAG: SGNH/GDSL hydrolase family protein, partial [Rhodospirillales bacterium]|nr:SGNH/GDSL hydrolase family protein [Rhodospirillales bacterium]
MKFVLKNGLLVLSVCVLSLLAFEGMTRLFLDDGMLYELEMWKYAREVKVRDPRPDFGHRHRTNARAELMGVTVRTNRFGARSADIADKAAPGVARIAFVGDSTTLGWGVAEQEAFAHQVIAQLTAAGRKVEGFNLGIGNYNTSQELALFREVGARLEPDIIVLSYFINDAEPMPNYPVYHWAVTRWLDEHSAAWVVLNYRLDSLARQFGEAPDWKRYYRDLYATNAEGWVRTQKALAGFAETAHKLGARLVVFNIPELRELKPYPFDDVTAKVRKVVESSGVPFIDLLPGVETLEPSSLWVTVPDPHPNGRAASAFARQMVPEISSILDDLCRNQSHGC